MSKKKMLLAEPVSILQAALRVGMTRLGWEVDLVVDEVSGLEKALTIPYDLILVEISQEDRMDGFSLVEKIKTQTTVNKDTPLCTITVHNIPENREKALLLGVNAFFEGVFLNEVVVDIDNYIASIR